MNPLVIDEQGRWLPFVYGMNTRYEIHPAATKPEQRNDRLQRVAELLRVAFDDADRDGAAYLDWFAHLSRVSRRQPPAPVSISA